jgi:hypothetical protein
MKYKISIVIPVFNVENYIRSALESIEANYQKFFFNGLSWIINLIYNITKNSKFTKKIKY